MATPGKETPKSHVLRGQSSSLAELDGQIGRAPIRVLFVGRSATATKFESLVGQWQRADRQGEGTLGEGETAGRQLIEFVALTNQKAALGTIRHQPPKVVFVEVDARPNSRVRFCEMLRYRVPTVLIYAMGRTFPQNSFDFDGFIRLPMTAKPVIDAIDQVRGQPVGHLWERGPIQLNVATRTVHTPNGQHHMTPKQCALLKYLMAHHNQIVRRRDIMESIWETSYLDDTRTLDVHIRWLRECIEPDPSNPVYLLTVRGEGYHLRVPSGG